MFAAPQKPKDNLLYAQQLIEAKDEEGSKLVQMVLELSINGVDVDTILLEENNGTLLHHCAKVRRGVVDSCPGYLEYWVSLLLINYVSSSDSHKLAEIYIAGGACNS